MRLHPLGIGESLGDDLIVNGPLLHSGQVWWVDDATGADATSPRGLSRERPLATLAQAVSNAADGDIIVLADGHNEVISTAAPLVVSKSLVIVGSGQSSGKPTVKLAFTGAAAAPIQVTGDAVEFRNIWFEAQGSANANAKIDVDAGAAYFRMVGCYVECNGNDDGFALDLAGVAPEVRNTTFISTSTTAATAPKAAVKLDGATRAILTGCTFDGGTVGWDNGWAVDCDNTADSLLVKLENITCSRGSDIRLQLNTTGHVMVSEGSYAPRIDWSGTEAGA